MKIIKRMVCLCIICSICMTGCGIAQQLDHSSSSGDIAALNATVDASESADVTLNPEDIKTFVFEGDEYTFPVSYDTFIEKGWKISDKSYQIFEDGNKSPTFTMESDDYPGLVMDFDMNRGYWQDGGLMETMDEDALPSSVDEMVSELESNGVWGIGIYPDSEGEFEEISAYPELSFKGVSFGNSSADIVDAFGTPDSDIIEIVGDNEYAYFSSATTMKSSSIFFSVENDSVYSIVVTYYED